MTVYTSLVVMNIHDSVERKKVRKTMAMTTERYIQQAKDEAMTEVQLFRSRRPDEVVDEAWATKMVRTKWINNFLSQKDLPIEVEQAFKSTFISEITK
jgi:hypothetical protein